MDDSSAPKRKTKSPAKPSDRSSRPKSSTFTLDPDRKAALLSLLIGVMLAATVIAVLQPLRPDPREAGGAQKFWYPFETNPYARLTGVGCANDYACQLNDIAVISTG